MEDVKIQLRGVLMEKVVIKGKRIVGGVAEGVAFLSQDLPFELGGGKLQKKADGFGGEKEGHIGKILVFSDVELDFGKSGELQVTKLKEYMPKAVIFKNTTPKMLLGSIVMDIPVVTDFEKDPLEFICTGDWVRVDADNEQVIVFKR